MEIHLNRWVLEGEISFGSMKYETVKAFLSHRKGCFGHQTMLIYHIGLHDTTTDYEYD